jgi:hypothetical protein
MKSLVSIGVIGLAVLTAQPSRAEMITINVNRVCAAIVGIPYASDNFTDEEWQKFLNCRSYLQRFNGIE